MKSFVSQGKNILDAINKALVVADFPQHFTVKILEQGERSFFWWKNKEAIILFFYEIADLNTDNSKKKIKKNYNKEDAFVNKNVNNQFDELEYTSVIKSDINSNKASNNNFNKNKSNQEGVINKKIKEIDFNKKNESKNSGLNEPQSLLGAVLQNKSKIIENNITSKIKKNNTIEEKELQNKEEAKNIKLKEWKKEYIDFVENWINLLNDNFNFSNDKVILSLRDDALIIKIENFRECYSVSKKHLFSSIVIMLYETLKMNFSDFDNRYYKIILE